MKTGLFLSFCENWFISTTKHNPILLPTFSNTPYFSHISLHTPTHSAKPPPAPPHNSPHLSPFLSSLPPPHPNTYQFLTPLPTLLHTPKSLHTSLHTLPHTFPHILLIYPIPQRTFPHLSPHFSIRSPHSHTLPPHLSSHFPSPPPHPSHFSTSLPTCPLIYYRFYILYFLANEVSCLVTLKSHLDLEAMMSRLGRFGPRSSSVVKSMTSFVSCLKCGGA